MVIIPPPNHNSLDYRKGHGRRLNPPGGSRHPLFLLCLGAVFGFVFGFLFGGDESGCDNGSSTVDFLLPGREQRLDNAFGSGWKTINVFYGSSEHVESLISPNRQWYSQVRQDEAIISLLGGKRQGYFVDLASNDATVLSNTYALERHFNWSGLCIEPNADYFYNLTHYRKNCELVAAVVGGNRMEKVHFFAAGDHSGIVGFDNPKRLKSRKETRIEYTVTLLEIFERFHVPFEIDYLSLDVEGAEEFVMTVFPLEKYRVKLMTIERPTEKLRKLLASKGYIQIQRLSRWGETLWAHGDTINELDMSRLTEFHAKRQYLLEKETSKLTRRL